MTGGTRRCSVHSSRRRSWKPGKTLARRKTREGDGELRSSFLSPPCRGDCCWWAQRPTARSAALWHRAPPRSPARRTAGDAPRDSGAGLACGLRACGLRAAAPGLRPGVRSRTADPRTLTDGGELHPHRPPRLVRLDTGPDCHQKPQTTQLLLPWAGPAHGVSPWESLTSRLLSGKGRSWARSSLPAGGGCGLGPGMFKTLV